MVLTLVACGSGAGAGQAPDTERPLGGGSPGEGVVSISPSTTTVFFDEDIEFIVELDGAEVADADATWSSTGGVFSSSHGSRTTWTAPREEATFSITVSVVVNGETKSDTVQVTVLPDPSKNYLIVQANPAHTKIGPTGNIISTFGLEVELLAQVIGPDAEGAYIEWHIVEGGGTFASFTNLPRVLMKTPTATGTTKIRATARLRDEILDERVEIEIIKPLELVGILPEDVRIGIGNTLDLELVFGGYYQDNVEVAWSHAFDQSLQNNPIPYGVVQWDGTRFARFTAPKEEILLNISFRATVPGVARHEILGDIPLQVGLCDAGSERSPTDPCRIQNVHQLQAISATRDRLQGHYLMTRDIDASETATWNQGEGFLPIGRSPITPLTGTFDGGGHVIDGLVIKPPATFQNMVGLFAGVSNGTIENLTLSNLQVNGVDFVGGFAARAAGATFRNLHLVDSEITGEWMVGGVVGEVSIEAAPSDPVTTISDVVVSGVTLTLSGLYDPGNPDLFGGLGGIVAMGNRVEISDVLVNDDSKILGYSDHVGGIIGLAGPQTLVQSATVENSEVMMTMYSNGNRESHHLGGIAGRNNGDITDALVRGTDIAGSGRNIGGVVGFNGEFGVITDTHISDSLVLRPKTFNQDNAGGFVAFNEGQITGGTVTEVTVRSAIGASGFVGWNARLGQVENAHVINSHVEIDHSFEPNGLPINGRHRVGGFTARNDGDIQGASVVNTNVKGAFDLTGGFAALNENTGVISDSFVYGPDIILHGNGSYVGGFVADNSGKLERTYAILNGVTGEGSYIGGLVGAHVSAAPPSNLAWIEHSYALADVRRIGGDEGNKHVGALVGYNPGASNDKGRVIRSYWSSDVATSYPHSPGGGENKTLVELERQGTYTSSGTWKWNFTGQGANWVMPSTSKPGPRTPDLINNSRY